MLEPGSSGGGAINPPVAEVVPAVSYALLSSYETVQVLTPTLTNDVVYCTIQTLPSGVIASTPVQTKLFNAGQAGPILAALASAIEQVMADDRVIAGVGSQTRAESGLLVDDVIFTVEYIDPVHAPLGATAQVTIGVGQLNFGDAQIGRTLLAGIKTKIDAVYANLKAAAGG